MWLDETWKWAQIFTGDTLGADRRRQGVAVEPMSCPADALRSGRDLVTLEPGDTLAGSWGVVVESR
jgi:aldose 1-epimerase